jgi:hypothetical protein
MEKKILGALVMFMMLTQNSQAIQLTSSSVVGNVLFEQGTLYFIALMMLIAVLAL